MQKLPDVKRILIVNLGGLGDCLLSMPSLRLLKTSYSPARVVLLTIERSAGLFKGFNYLDEIIIFELGFLAKLKLFLKLRNMHFDLVVNMRPLTSIASSIKMALMFFIINAPLRVGRDTENRGFFLNVKVPELDNASMHDLDYYFYMFKPLGLESDDRDINLAVESKNIEYIDRYLAGQGVSKADILIGMNLGASWQSRRWPIENFSELISLLLKKGNFKIIITATKKEKQLVNKLKGLVDAKIIDASEETNPGQLLALIKRCNLFVSNDAGPMHLAAALHTPLIAIFGPGEFIRYDPRRLWEKAVVFYKKIDCAPCIKANCSFLECLRSITAQEVADAAIKLL